LVKKKKKPTIPKKKKKSPFFGRTPPPPPQWFPWPLHAWKTVTQIRFKSSTIARILRNYNTEQLLGYLGKPSLGKIQTRICGKSIQGKHNVHYSTLLGWRENINYNSSNCNVDISAQTHYFLFILWHYQDV